MSRIDALAGALPRLAADSARHARLAAATRAELRKTLARKNMRKLADADPELGAHVTRAADALARQDEAAGAWQKSLGEATKRWKAALTGLSEAHPDRD
ncbi:hypothetical protein E1264_14730 [Actinomadura sp. KC216]|uniref:hypothetical protein n=1 Tax=Actinomadura sp. KC216 TaxID=2530370 RepID=UPI0010524D63|nr:hypothetical protein [Actinomadura sp. KC216]TDB87417.1 hypothetical protein E1264_14730 [Actinomadura sp. KC216]